MADVNIIIDIAAKGAVKQLNKLEKEFDDLDKTAKKAGKDTDKAFGIISKGAAGAAVAVAALGAGLVSAVNQASKLQDLETQFIAFTGSAEGAADQVERIAEFSGQTPFQLEELVTANRTLLAFGQSTEQSLTTLNQLGEAAAGTGANIEDLALIFGQIEAAGKLTGERFNQLSERGLNLGPALAKGLGVAESELEDLRRQGKITSEDVLRALESMTTGTGQFAGSMERLSLTFSGATSTLSDNIGLLAADLGKKLLPGVTDITVGFTEAVKWVRQFTKETKTDRIEAFNGQIEATERTIANLNQQLQAASEGGVLFKIFGGDPAEETKRLNEELKKAEANLAALKAQRDATQARPESDFDDPQGGLGDPAQNQEAIAAAQKLSSELQNINQQRVANQKALGETENAQLIEQLDLQRETLLQKEAEKNVALLESQGLFEEAQLIQAEENLRRLEEAEKLSLEKKRKAAEKAQQDEFNFTKRATEAELAYQQATTLEKVKTVQQGFGIIAGLQQTASKEAFQLGKAAAVAQAALNIPQAASNAFTVGAKLGGPPTGAAFAAIATAVQLANLQKISSQRFTGFADGGLVEGGTPGRDSVPALLTPGEVVVPQKNFNDLGMNNEESVFELKRLNRNIEDQNTVLFNISQNTNDTAIGTTRVAAGVANIQLPGTNNPGSGADYTDWNIEAYVEANRILQERIAQQAANDFANQSIGNTNAGQGNIQTGG